LLRVRYPFFWGSLNQRWRQGGILERDALGGSPLDDWLVEIDVIDDWLIDCVKAAIDLWNSDPNGGSANLDPKCPWFALPEDAIDSEASDVFLPLLWSPFPLYRGPDISSLYSKMRTLSIDDQEWLLDKVDSADWFEPLEEYERRLKQDFHNQLTEHIRRLRQTRYGLDHAEGFKHSQWTALAFGGMPYAEIARRELADTLNRDPDSTVRKAVVRFAEDIDLTEQQGE
jgi:hypothetical protein